MRSYSKTSTTPYRSPIIFLRGNPLQGSTHSSTLPKQNRPRQMEKLSKMPSPNPSNPQPETAVQITTADLHELMKLWVIEKLGLTPQQWGRFTAIQSPGL